MNSPARREPMRFTRGGRAYIIAPAYAANEGGYVGLCDGRVVCSADNRADVARALIQPSEQVSGAIGNEAYGAQLELLTH